MLKFFCICGHSRGTHAECTRPKNEVGGYNSCKCNKYYSDKKKNKNTSNNYGKLVLRILLPPLATLILCVFLIGELDDAFNGLSEFFYGIAFVVTFVYFTIIKPLDKIQNKTLSR